MNQTTPLVKRKTSRCHNVPFFLLSVLSIGLTIALFVWGSFNGYLRWFSLPVSSSQGLFCGSSRKYGYSYSPQLFTFQNFTDTIEWCPTVWTMIILGVFFPLKAVALFYQWKKPNPSSVKINSLHRLLKIVYSRSLGMLFSVLVFSLLYVFVVCGTCLLGLQMLSHFFIHKNRAQSTIHADVFFFLSLFSMLFGSLVFLNFIRELNNAALSLFFRLRLEELRCGDVLIDFDEKLPFLARPFVLEEKQKSFSFVHSLVYQISHNLCSIVSHSFTASLHTVLKIIVSPLFFVLQLVSSFSSASYSFRKEPIHTSLASPSLLVSAMFSLDSTTSKHHGYRVMRRNRHIFRAMDKTKRLTMRTERYFPVLICLIANLAVWFKFLPPFHSLLADPHSPEKIIAKWIAVGSSCVVGLIGMGAVVTPFSILLDVFVIRTRINKHFPPPSPSLSYSSTSSQKDHPGFSREGTWVDNILNDIDVSERDAKERQVRKWEGWDS
ncbi:hypothetical protein BLNAU_19621 [Blattamonas nauphoetae]|uniref:Uncharacterized protein n=1 Tax=Blattamonas nauphoetae TaxID=2049346 RepID=A0ABQ9X0Y9_9EUKA|nr:hypothetical protein BLNAU_19621 [Blattamonas nauphoetae]